MKYLRALSFASALALALSISACSSPEIVREADTKPLAAASATTTPAAAETTSSASSADNAGAAASGQPDITGAETSAQSTEVTTAGTPETTFSEAVTTSAARLAETTKEPPVTTKAARSAETTTAPVTAEQPLLTTEETTLVTAALPVITGNEPERQPDFSVPLEEGDIRLVILNDEEITTETRFVKIRIEYTAPEKNGCYFTGLEHKLDRLTEDGWRNVPFSDFLTWNALAMEISAESTPVGEISLDPAIYAEPLTPGKYRIRKYISDIPFCAEFTIKEATAPETETLADENGRVTLRIKEIQPDTFICYNFYPMPGTYRVECDTSAYPDLCVGDAVDVDYSVMYLYNNDDPEYRVIPTDINYTEQMLDPDVCYKPVIYLYPQETTEVTVKLDNNGRLTFTDPEYSDGWVVTAQPDGTLEYGGKEYPYLFWEAEMNYGIDTSRGFCVSGSETGDFLSEKLSLLGLNKKETAEFLEFWLPYMQRNNYNVITFAGADYTDNAVLDVSPAPDTVIRVFMVFSPSDDFVDIPPQELAPAARSGFTLAEWGGAMTPRFTAVR